MRTEIEFLESVHAYYLANQRFWYDLCLRQADSLIVVAASDLRNPALKPLLPLFVEKMESGWQALRAAAEKELDGPRGGE